MQVVRTVDNGAGVWQWPSNLYGACAGQLMGLVPPAARGGLEAGRQQLQHMLQVSGLVHTPAQDLDLSFGCGAKVMQVLKTGGNGGWGMAVAEQLESSDHGVGWVPCRVVGQAGGTPLISTHQGPPLFHLQCDLGPYAAALWTSHPLISTVAAGIPCGKPAG
jgi:hypothetical protein